MFYEYKCPSCGFINVRTGQYARIVCSSCKNEFDTYTISVYPIHPDIYWIPYRYWYDDQPYKYEVTWGTTTNRDDATGSVTYIS